MNGKQDRIEGELRELEEKIRQGCEDYEPVALKPPTSVYRNYRPSPFWRRSRKVLQWGGLAFGFYFLFFPTSASVPLEGKVVAREMRTIDVKLDGEVVSIMKSNGDRVKRGEVIGQIYNPLLHQEKKRLGAEIKVLETMRAGLKRKLESERAILSHYKTLFQAGDISRMKLDLQEITVQETDSDLAIKEAELQERHVRRSNLEDRLADAIIRSPLEGTITSPIEETLNTQVREGGKLGEVASGRMRFEFRISEEAVGSIEIGQILTITLEAFPQRRLKGKVKEIRPIVFEDNPKPWIKNYNARILVSSLTDMPEGTRLGMTGRCRVRLSRKGSRLLKWLKEWKTRLGE